MISIKEEGELSGDEKDMSNENKFGLTGKISACLKDRVYTLKAGKIKLGR